MCISVLFFILGSTFTISIVWQMWILTIVTGLLYIIFGIGFKGYLEHLAGYGISEDIMQKLCYIYVVIDIAANEFHANDNRLIKTIKRILKEIALDVYGPGKGYIWDKWEAKIKEKIKEEMKNNGK